MKKRTRIILTIALIVIISLGVGLWLFVRHGFSAREQPTALEAVIARATRNLAIPSDARDLKNPFLPTEDVVRGARNRYEDKCSECHANDGSGLTDIGQNLYPKPPDLRLSRTQNLKDGEIYYIIHNGIRLTGMPAWGPVKSDSGAWKLVLYIRQLPKLTESDIEQMNDANPEGAARPQPVPH